MQHRFYPIVTALLAAPSVKLLEIPDTIVLDALRLRWRRRFAHSDPPASGLRTVVPGSHLRLLLGLSSTQIRSANPAPVIWKLCPGSNRETECLVESQERFPRRINSGGEYCWEGLKILGTMAVGRLGGRVAFGRFEGDW
jgi:hypothetical protein